MIAHLMENRRLIEGISARVEQFAAELKNINKKLDYCVVRLGPGNPEEIHPIVEEALKAIEEGEQQ